MRVLLVEDEIKMSRALRRGLEQEGYAVDAALDGHDGLHRATEWDYDAIVLDVLLPAWTASRSAGGCAGPAGGRRCSCSPPATGWPTGSAASTSAPTTTWSSRSRSGSCWPACVPWSAGARRERPAVLTVGDLVLDPAAHTVTLSGRPVSLCGPGVRPARVPHAPRRPGGDAGPRSSSTSGTTTMTASPTSSTSTSATSVASSSSRPARSASAPSGASATGSSPRSGMAGWLDPPPGPGPPHGLVRGPARGDPGHARLVPAVAPAGRPGGRGRQGARRPGGRRSWPTPTAGPAERCRATSVAGLPAATTGRPAAVLRRPGPGPGRPRDAGRGPCSPRRWCAGAATATRYGPRCGRVRTGRATGCSACAGPGRRRRCWRSRPR